MHWQLGNSLRRVPAWARVERVRRWPPPDQPSGFLAFGDLGELGGKLALEEDRDFGAEIKPANLKQVIKAACNRLRPACQRTEQNAVINGIPRGIDSIGCLPRAAGKATKLLFDNVVRMTLPNNLREEAVKFDRVLRRPAQSLGEFPQELLSEIQPIPVFFGVVLLQIPQSLLPGRREARALAETADRFSESRNKGAPQAGVDSFATQPRLGDDAGYGAVVAGWRISGVHKHSGALSL